MQKYAFQTDEHRLKSVKTLQTSFYIYTYRICSVPNLRYVTRQLFRQFRADKFLSKILITVAAYLANLNDTTQTKLHAREKKTQQKQTHIKKGNKIY